MFRYTERGFKNRQNSVYVLVEREVPKFYNNCALPDTSMTLSAFVLQTFLVTKSMLANTIFSIFKMATMIFKMVVKIIIIKQIKKNLLPKLVFFSSPEPKAHKVSL